MKFARFYRLMNQEGDQGTGGGGSDDKKGTGGSDDQNKEGDKTKDKSSGGDKFDVASLPKEAQDLIKSLRDENAKHRKANTSLTERMSKIEKSLKLDGDEDDKELSPELKLERLTGNNDSLKIKNTLLNLALENGIGGGESYEYFEYLMQKKLDSLEEDQELGEEALEEVLAKVKKQPKAPANTTVKEEGKDKKSKSDASEVTLEQYMKMNMTQKSDLYLRQPDLYNRLQAEARGK